MKWLMSNILVATKEGLFLIHIFNIIITIKHSNAYLGQTQLYNLPNLCPP